MGTRDAAQTLRRVEQVRRSTRSALDNAWLPFVVFGLITMGSAAFTGVWQGAGVGVWWVIAGPLGLAFTWRYYREREIRVGLFDRREHVYAGMTAGIFAAAFALGAAGRGDLLSDVGPTFAVGTGLLGLAVFDRKPIIGACGAAELGLAIAVTLTKPAHSGPLMALAGGAILVVSGLLLRSRTRARA
jgi:hypothetical protein